MKTMDAFMVDDDNISFPGRGAGKLLSAAPPRQRESVAAAVLLDLDTTGMFIACAASAVNFAARHPDLATAALAELPSWLPASPASVQSTQLARLRDDLSVAVCSGLRDLGLHLEIACRATRRHCERVASRAPVSSDAGEELVNLWGLLCERTMALQQELRPLVSSTEASAGTSEEAEASSERLLAAAALGHWPCIGPRGTITIPGWSERRGDSRCHVCIDCRIVAADRTWLARTADFSLNGVGLTGAPPLEAGTRAVIAIGSQAELPGQVVWSDGDRLGFRFDQPLDSLAAVGRSLMSE